MPSPPRALLAEDDPATAAVLTHRLQRDGFEVLPCADGETALARVAAEPVDLVLAGANLPGVDGLGVLRGVRADPAVASVPFVLLAWPGNDAAVAQAFAQGADEVIVRPFSLVEASARVRRLVGRRTA